MKKIGLALVVLVTTNLLAGKLSNEELKNKGFCDNTPTGVSLWSSSLLESKQTQNQAGLKSEFIKDIMGGDLTWEIGQGRNMVYVDLKKIDAGEFKEDGIECYEVQSIQNKKNGKVLSLEDQTLTPTIKAATYLFGFPLGSKQDKRDKEAAIGKANAEQIAKDKEEIEKKKQAEIEKLENEKAALKVAKAKEEAKRNADAEALAEREKLQNIKAKDEREQRKFNRNKIRESMTVWNDFKAKYKIESKNKMGPLFKTGKISDDTLYGILDDMDTFLVKLPFVDKNRKEKIVEGDVKIYIDWKGGEYYNRALKDINRMLTQKPDWRNSDGKFGTFVYYMDNELNSHLKKIYR